MVGGSSVTSSLATDALPPTSQHLASKKDHAPADPTELLDLLGTLVQTHTDEHVMLDEASPSEERLEELLADRVTGQRHPIDPRLLDAVRRLVRQRPELPVRVEIVSGYRSEKLNEMLRKKGHHVASHSQHSLGRALDFRIEGLSPLEIEQALRALGWDGGIGVYLSQGDLFTHADTGPMRRWNGQ
jgi:uncharacterized protein YcbK (DUF882 family)